MNWEGLDSDARRNPGPTEVLHVDAVAMLRHYAVDHERRYGSPIGHDAVLGDGWLMIASGLRALLNGNIGRLDAGKCDRLLCELVSSVGFSESELSKAGF